MRVERGKLLVPLVIIILSSAFVSGATTAFFRIQAKSCDELYSALQDIEENPFMIFFKIGVYHFRQGEYDKAAASFQKSMSLKCDFEEAYHNLGVVYYAQNRFDEAAVEFGKAVAINPRYVQAYYSAGLLYFELQDFGSAISNFQKVVELDRGNVNATFDLGVAAVEEFRRTKDIRYLDQGIAAYHEVISLDPSFPYAGKNLEIVESIRSRISEAGLS